MRAFYITGSGTSPSIGTGTGTGTCTSFWEEECLILALGTQEGTLPNPNPFAVDVQGLHCQW